MEIYNIQMVDVATERTIATYIGPAKWRKEAVERCLIRAKNAGKLTDYEFEVLKSVLYGRKLNPLNKKCGFYFGKGIDLNQWLFGVFSAPAKTIDNI